MLKPSSLGLLTFLIALSGCGETAERRTITLATTTSTRDSGLLDELTPRFLERTGIRVKVVAVGSGQALELGRRGDADVLLTHAPDVERKFVAEGYGLERLPAMSNAFILVGPKSDPAKLGGEPSIGAAFKRICETKSLFVSRGDESGTHMKERNVWKQVGISPHGEWYVEGGSGMAHTLRIASEKSAYTLTDRGTWLAHREKLDLVVASAGDPLLRNPYAVILVNPRKHPHVRSGDARRFAAFLLSVETQAVIERFGVKRHGEPLFHPLKTADTDGS